MLTRGRLRAVVEYDPELGLFRWIEPGPKRVVGSIAGAIKRDGYRYIGIDLRRYKAARLAWIYQYGDIPDGMLVDHINRDRSDDRISNLRLVTASQNMMNTSRRSNNKSGHKGIHRHSQNGNWVVQISAYRQRKHVGVFNDLEDAIRAYNAASASLHGNYANCGG